MNRGYSGEALGTRFLWLYRRIEAVFGELVLGEGLRAKTMRGGAWLGTGSLAEQTARFARNMLLARILTPGAFGTMAIVMSSASLVDTLTDVGMKAAVIQNPQGGKWDYLNASWWLGMARAVFSYSIIFIVAPWVAIFYGRPELTGLLRVALMGTLLAGAMSPRTILMQREMTFARWAAITNGGGVCGVVMTVVLSLFIRDVWALAIGYCGEQAFRCFLSYALCPGLPSLKLDWRAARELLGFSRQVVGLSFMNVIIGRADVFVLARLYSTTALGLYAMGISLVATPTGFLINVLGQGLMPALSRVQEDTERVNRILLDVTAWLALLGLPVAIAICLCAPHLLAVVYGSRYMAAVGPLCIATAVALINVVYHATSCVLYAEGRPAVHRWAAAATTTATVVAMYPACRYLGPVGGQAAALLSVAIGFMFQLARLHQIARLKLSRYVGVFVSPALGAIGMAGVVLAGRSLGLTGRSTVDITLCAASCVAAQAVCALAHLRYRRGREPSIETKGSVPAVTFTR